MRSSIHFPIFQYLGFQVLVQTVWPNWFHFFTRIFFISLSMVSLLFKQLMRSDLETYIDNVQNH